MRFGTDSVSRDEVRDALELCLVLGTGLVVHMAKVRKQQFVALQLRHDVEQDTFSVCFVVGVDVDIEPVTSRTHFLTVVAQRVDYLLPRDDPAKANRRLRGLAICDPGGLLYRSGNQVVKVLVERLMKARWSEVEILSELERGEEEE